MVTARDFIKKARIPLDEGWGYIYGTWGVLWTAERQALATRDMTVKYGSRWIGRMVTDCSGLLRWALYQLGENIAHHARYQYTDWSRNKGRLVNGRREDGSLPLPGTAVFLQGSQEHIHHVGVYIGDGFCIEAKGTLYGVVTSQLNHWDHWGELKMVDYTDAAELENGELIPEAAGEQGQMARVENQNQWLNVRSGPGTHYPVQFRVSRGSTVRILDDTVPDWRQISYGGRIGWASAQYLAPVGPEQAEAMAEPEEPEEPDQLPAHSEMDKMADALGGLRAVVERLEDVIRKLEKLEERQ